MKPYLWVLLLAAVPLAENRMAIPVGILHYKLAPITTAVWAIIGGLLPILTLSKHFPKLLNLTLHLLPTKLENLVNHRLSKLQKKFQTKYLKQGLVALVVLVALPFPGTGIWTGLAVATIFKIPPDQYIPAISLGLVISTALITATTVLGVKWYQLLS